MYVGSDGRSYSPSELIDNFESGGWRTCVRDEDDGRQLVETGDGEFLLLVPYRTLDDKERVREDLDIP